MLDTQVVHLIYCSLYTNNNVNSILNKQIFLILICIALFTHSSGVYVTPGPHLLNSENFILVFIHERLKSNQTFSIKMVRINRCCCFYKIILTQLYIVNFLYISFVLFQVIFKYSIYIYVY